MDKTLQIHLYKNSTIKLLTLRSLTVSRSWLLVSWSPWASDRSWVKMRTASPRMVALSVLGGLPGSKAELNSRNLQIDQILVNTQGKTILRSTYSSFHIKCSEFTPGPDVHNKGALLIIWWRYTSDDSVLTSTPLTLAYHMLYIRKSNLAC